MFRQFMPRISVLPKTVVEPAFQHAILISLLRGLAALQVAAAHLRAQMYPGLKQLDDPTLWYQALAFVTGFAHQAVVVFFLISGWLVGGSLLDKMGQPDALRRYAIDRVSRLWTVLLPSFALAAAFGILNGTLDARHADFSPSNPYSWSALAGNLAGLQTVAVPQFGGNYPLWSLANESWYYLMFPLLLLYMAGHRRALWGGALMLCAAVLPFSITLYFTIWLLGAAFSRVRLECGPAARVLLLVLLATLSVHFRLNGSNDDLVAASFGQDLLLSLVFLALLSSTVVRAGPGWPRLRATAGWLSRCSFTLYVVHVPVLGMLRWLGQHLFGVSRMQAGSLLDLAIYLAMLALVVGFAYGFYLLFEARTGQVRRILKKLLLAKAQPGLRAM